MKKGSYYYKKKNPFPFSVLLILFDDINQVRPSDEAAKQLFLNYVLKIDLENIIYIHTYIINRVLILKITFLVDIFF